MDKNVLDFWGNLFLNAARNQRQMEEIAGWTQKAITSLSNWTASLMKPPEGVEAAKQEPANLFDSWKKVGDDYQKLLLKSYLGFWGITADPQEQLELIRKYEELKEKLASQEETIKHLRLLLKEAKKDYKSSDGNRQRDQQPEAEIQWNRAPSSSPT